jgi:hypothetical protein
MTGRMRKAYAQALRELFAEGLAAASPDFEFVRRHQPLAGIPGERAFRRTVSPDIVQWLVVVPDLKREVFFLEVGWSRRGRFPQLTMRPSFVRPADAGREGEVLIRLRELAGENDFGWTIDEPPMGGNRDDMLAYLIAQTAPLEPEVARARVAPHVEEALAMWIELGRPFLERHAGGA